MEKKYQIFISSTYEDLKEARAKVSEAILSMHHFPVGMEQFNAASVEQWKIIMETIDTSDYYVLIIGQRYGSIFKDGPDKGMSYTEKEFRYAIKQKVPVLAFIMDDNASVKKSDVEQNPRSIQKLKKFKELVQDGRQVVWWSTVDELASKVVLALESEFSRTLRKGWIRNRGDYNFIDIEYYIKEAHSLLEWQIREIDKSITMYGSSFCVGDDLVFESPFICRQRIETEHDIEPLMAYLSICANGSDESYGILSRDVLKIAKVDLNNGIVLEGSISLFKIGYFIYNLEQAVNDVIFEWDKCDGCIVYIIRHSYSELGISLDVMRVFDKIRKKYGTEFVFAGGLVDENAYKTEKMILICHYKDEQDKEI